MQAFADRAPSVHTVLPRLGPETYTVECMPRDWDSWLQFHCGTVRMVRRWSTIGIGILAILNVVASAMQYRWDYGVKAVAHERAAGLYAILNRRMEIQSTQEEISEEALRGIKDQLDELAMTLPYPPKRFRDTPDDVTKRIEELEMELAEGRPADRTLTLTQRQTG
jgi:hypothetical protein